MRRALVLHSVKSLLNSFVLAESVTAVARCGFQEKVLNF
jgi:hypothetical protein